MKADYTAASVQPVTNVAKVAPATPDMFVTDLPSVPIGLDLHAFTRCPDCKSIMHRKTGCTWCGAGTRGRE